MQVGRGKARDRGSWAYRLAVVRRYRRDAQYGRGLAMVRQLRAEVTSWSREGAWCAPLVPLSGLPSKQTSCGLLSGLLSRGRWLGA